MEWLNFAAQIASSAIRLSVPLLFACLAGLYSERSGVFDIGLEGKMLVAAFAAGAIAAISGSAWLGLFAAIAASVAFSLVHGFASITHRGNQIVSGVAINFIAFGLTAQLGATWFGTGGQTPQLGDNARFLSIDWPLDVTVIAPRDAAWADRSRALAPVSPAQLRTANSPELFIGTCPGQEKGAA